MKLKLIHFRPSIAGYSFCLLFDNTYSIAVSQDHHSQIISSKKFKIKLKHVNIEGIATLRRLASLLSPCFCLCSSVAVSILCTMHILGVYTCQSY